MFREVQLSVGEQQKCSIQLNIFTSMHSSMSLGWTNCNQDHLIKPRRYHILKRELLNETWSCSSLSFSLVWEWQISLCLKRNSEGWAKSSLLCAWFRYWRCSLGPHPGRSNFRNCWATLKSSELLQLSYSFFISLICSSLSLLAVLTHMLSASAL